MKKTKVILKRFGIAIPAPGAEGREFQLASGKDQPGPATFSTWDEAMADIKFNSRYGATPVEVTIAFSI